MCDVMDRWREIRPQMTQSGTKMSSAGRVDGYGAKMSKNGVIYHQAEGSNPPGRLLSLYSTATQSTWHWGLALGNAPNARILGWSQFCVLEPTQTFKLASPPTPNLKLAFYPTQNPNASQWNIGCVGSQRKILPLAMYISFFFV